MKIDGGKEPSDFDYHDGLVPTVPTIGVQLEDIKFKNLDIKVWDLSGQEKLRGTWQYYYETVNGLIFVVDSSNLEQLQEVRDTLHQVIAETSDNKVPILIFANKQDKPGALGYSEIRNELALAGESEIRRSIKIIESSGLNNKGLEEGFSWLVETITAAASK